MKRFNCYCGNSVFFEQTNCDRCGKTLGFDFNSMKMIPLSKNGSLLIDSASKKTYKKCTNWTEFNVCNWVLEDSSKNDLCFACQFNRVIPNQSADNAPVNNLRWLRLEKAKKRLIFSLARIGLPLKNGWGSSVEGLLFDFVESMGDKVVTTGYSDGIITINSLEADHVARVSAKYALNERYRTIIGHLRHETGHYYLDKFDLPPNLKKILEDNFGNLFNKNLSEYNEALQSYYKNGPAENWEENYISAYASAHPIEDWAESWSHYLLIMDTLETLQEEGYFDDCIDKMNITEKLEKWRSLSSSLNQITRSLGMQDAYPFTLGKKVSEKIACVSKFIAWICQDNAIEMQYLIDN